MRWFRTTTIAITMFCLAGLAAAEPMPAFGPQTFERTTGGSDLYAESFDAPAGGAFVLFVRNGDAESSRVSGATVTLNGSGIVGPGDLGETVPGLRREIELLAGANELQVELDGAPGSFITLAIAEPGRPPVFIAGRLLLPWGRNDGERALALALKNGSHHAPRAFRVVFFSPDGQPVAASDRRTLPPRGSVAIGADELIGVGAWQVGSVEIFYAGPGVSRLFGTARQIDAGSGQAEIETLEKAGQTVFRGRPDRADNGLQRRPGH